MGSTASFDVPFVSRGKAIDHGDGYDICEEGKVIVSQKYLSVYERSEFEAGSEAPILVIDVLNLDHVEAAKFRSVGGHFFGGRIILTGTFDRPFKEKLVLKMELLEYKRMKTALKTIEGMLDG